MMQAIGIEERDIEDLIRSNKSDEVLTDDELFAISDLFHRNRFMNIFFSRKIGDMTVNFKFVNNEVVYTITSGKGKMCANVYVCTEFHYIIIEYPDIKVDVINNLYGYSSKSTMFMNLRMQFLDEILVRYFKKVIYAIYLELKRR